ncbi:MAG TPA: hypothetical protein VJM50_17565 [Pyrinomonadaceae bacterium]|nr:hypothetical protein [Pyrinomonadaceae bacterium]
MTNRNIEAGRLVNGTGGGGVSADIDNPTGKAAHVVIDITSITGTTPTATFTVQGKDPVSGKYYTLLASAALNANGTTVLKIGPGLTAAANLVANDVVPRTIRVSWSTTGTITDLDATVGVCLID